MSYIITIRGKSMRKEWNAVEILRHSRHDWLNKIQLIKGNMALGRYDRVNEIIEEIILESKNEAKLSNLKAPNLASFLMLFNWEDRTLSLEIEVIGDEQDLSLYDDEITSWCRNFLNYVNQAVKPVAENHLILSIQLDEGEVRFIFDFNGIIEDKQEILNFLESELISPTIKILDYEVHNDEMIVTVQILTASEKR